MLKEMRNFLCLELPPISTLRECCKGSSPNHIHEPADLLISENASTETDLSSVASALDSQVEESQEFRVLIVEDNPLNLRSVRTVLFQEFLKP